MIFKRSRSLKEILFYNRLTEKIETCENAGNGNIVTLNHFLELLEGDEAWSIIWKKCKGNLDLPKRFQDKEEELHCSHFVLNLPEELTESEIPSLAFRIASTCWTLFQNINASKFKTDPNTLAMTELHEMLYKWSSERSRSNGKALVILAQKLYHLKSFHSVIAILWALALADYKVPNSLADWGSPAKNFGSYRQELEEASFGIPFIGLVLKDMEFSSVGIFLEDDMINLSQLSTFYDTTVKPIEKFQNQNGKSRPLLSRKRSLLGVTMKVALN